MSDRREPPEEFLTGAKPGVAGGRFRWFLFWVLLLPVVFYFVAIPLVRLPSYERWGPSHYGPMLDFDYHTQGQDADVVVFGDSSAFLGVDPRVVERETGLKTVVLPNTVGSLPVLGDQALGFYLAHNWRPRLIVLYFTGWDLDYARSGETHLYEGEEMLLRHGSAGEIVAFGRTHPLELLAFPLRSYSSVGPTILTGLLHGENRERAVAAAGGHADDREGYPALLAGCRIPAGDLAALATGTVGGLMDKYRAQGYAVAVYLAPVPGCVNAGELAGRTYGVARAPAAVLPAGSFLDDGLFAHVRPEAVGAASGLFAEWVRGVVGR